MANVLQVINHQGPLPISATVEVVSNAPMVLLLSGSAWTKTAETMIGVKVLLDGVQVATASLFANPSSTHLALVTTATPITTTIGSHTFEIALLNANTVSDFNDNYSLTLIY